MKEGLGEVEGVAAVVKEVCAAAVAGSVTAGSYHVMIAGNPPSVCQLPALERVRHAYQKDLSSSLAPGPDRLHSEPAAALPCGKELRGHAFRCGDP